MKKLITILAVMICISANCQEKVQLKGVVTYFFNDNFGNKPDVGTEILIHKISESDTLHDIIEKHTTNQMIYNSSLEMSKYIRTSEFQESFKLKEQNYKGTKILVDSYIDNLKKDSELIEMTIDGSGNYSIDLPPGFYEIIAISKNRLGRILSKKRNINNDKPAIVDFEFGRI